MARTKPLTNLYTLQSAAVADANGTAVAIAGVAGKLMLLISNGAGTCTVTVQGSMDNFATAQDVLSLGVTKLADSGAGTNTTRTVVSGAISVAANTSYLYSIADATHDLRAKISSSANLGAGTNVTGCTVKFYCVAD